MKRFIITSTGEECDLGDTIIFSENSVTKNCTAVTTFSYYLTEEVIKDLVETGELTVKKDKINMGFNYWAKRASENIGEDRDIYLHILMKDIARELDNFYEDHISKAPEIYGFSMVTGTIIKIPKNKIKSYKTFAAFRSVEDAKIACKILSPLIKELFSDKK